MATQFEILNGKLDNLLHRMTNIEVLLREWIALEDEEDRLSLDAEVNEVGSDNPPPKRKMNRREVEVRGLTGDNKMVPWDQLDPRVVKAVEISVKEGLDYELYEDPTGNVRIQVDVEAARLIQQRMAQPGEQAPVPQDDRGIEGFELG